MSGCIIGYDEIWTLDKVGNKFRILLPTTYRVEIVSRFLFLSLMFKNGVPKYRPSDPFGRA